MTAALLAAVALAASPALADEPISSDRQRAVLQQELERHMGQLTLPDAPPLYHLRYHLYGLHQAQARASFGGLVVSEASPFNALGIEVRVGSAAFDNTGYGGWESGFGRISLPEQVSEHALRLGAWQLSDGTYKNAVEQHARKAAAFTPPPDYPGDFQLSDGRRVVAPAAPPADRAVVEDLAMRVSGAFPVDGSLELGSAIVAWESGVRAVIDSEGTEVQQPHSELVLRAMAQARAADGALLSDHRSWILQSPDQLPPAEQLEGEAQAMAQDLIAWTQAPTLQDEYVGPVIFEDQAAVDLFRALLVTQLEGTPPPVPFEARFGAMGEGFSFADDSAGGGARLNRRVLPAGWAVADDPATDPSHPASYTLDLEGSPAQRVELVQDGIVRTLLMSRVPRKDVPTGTNGHARGSLGSRPAGRVALLEVTPAKRASERKLRKRALELAAAYGHDHVIVVRRFQDDTVRAQDRSGASAFAFLGEDGPRLPVPLELYRVYADGREEPIRGAAFTKVDRWVLRDIVAAGEQVEGRYLAPFEPGGMAFSPIVGMPTGLSVPEVLVEELELVPVSADPRSKPAVPAPAE
jgi:TldD protein